MQLVDLRAFVRVAEVAGISAAARTLSLPKSTISRSLARLEAEVGAALVDRSTRHLRLTDAGMLFRPYALRILADVEEAGTALDNFAGVPRGTLRMSVPFTFAVALVAPMLPSFLARYPEVRVVLDVENRIVDIPVDKADLAIRVGALPDSDLVARHLMTTQAWTCASSSYPAACGTPATLQDLGRHSLIAGSDRATTWSYRLENGTAETVERVMTDNGSAFKSRRYRKALRWLCIKHKRTRPYTPKTNGKVERFVQTSLREWAYAKAYETSDHRKAELPTFLFQYNWHRPHMGIKANTPISRIGLSPDNLLRLHT